MFPGTLGVLIFGGVLLFVLDGGFRDEVKILAPLGPLVVGALIGWFTRARVPIWVFIALPVSGVVLFLIGFADYNDDGPSGPLFGPCLVLGVTAFAATALAAGMTLGASVRGTAD
jgi:hypothetical protein